MSKVHKESNKKIKNDSNVTTLPSGRSFFADKKGRSNRCKKVVSILGKRVTDGDLLPKGFHLNSNIRTRRPSHRRNASPRLSSEIRGTFRARFSR